MNYEESLAMYIDATNTHDFSNVTKLLHPKAVYWFSDTSCTTTKEIQQYFENAWNMIENEVYSAEHIQWITVDLNSATCIYTYHWEGYHKGSFISGSGRATNVFVKNDKDTWQLIHEHLSSQ